MAGLGLGASLLASVPAAVVGDVSPARGGRVVAVYQMVADLGAITGPLVAGWLADALSYQWAFGASAAVLGLGLVAALGMPRTVRPTGLARLSGALRPAAVVGRVGGQTFCRVQPAAQELPVHHPREV